MSIAHTLEHLFWQSLFCLFSCLITAAQWSNQLCFFKYDMHRSGDHLFIFFKSVHAPFGLTGRQVGTCQFQSIGRTQDATITTTASATLFPTWIYGSFDYSFLLSSIYPRDGSRSQLLFSSLSHDTRPCIIMCFYYYYYYYPFIFFPLFFFVEKRHGRDA